MRSSTAKRKGAAVVDPAKLAERRLTVMRHAREVGLVGEEKDARIGGRVSRRLLDTAKKRASVQSDTELIEYALARVALEEDFGERLFRREGRVSKDIDFGL